MNSGDETHENSKSMYIPVSATLPYPLLHVGNTRLDNQEMELRDYSNLKKEFNALSLKNKDLIYRGATTKGLLEVRQRPAGCFCDGARGAGGLERETRTRTGLLPSLVHTRTKKQNELDETGSSSNRYSWRGLQA